MPSKRRSGRKSRSSKAGNGIPVDWQQLELQTAFCYFEIENPGEATFSEIRKKYYRLSRNHHPDRNNGSEESKLEMQKINEYYELLENEFERREREEPKQRKHSPTKPTAKTSRYQKGSTGANTTKDHCHPSTTSKAPKPDRDFTSQHGISHEERQRRRKLKEQERQRAKKEKKREEEEENRRENEQRAEEEKRRRKEREEQMQKEQEEAKAFKQQKAEMKRYNRRMSKKERLTTPKGPRVAHQKWKTAKEAIEHREEIGDNNGASVCCKPPNPIMQYSNHNLAITLLLGATKIAMELVHEMIESCLEESMNEIMRYKALFGRPLNLTQSDLFAIAKHTYTTVLAAPMDEDGNHALFYAVYHEDNDMLTFLLNQADGCDHFAEYITSTNERGSTILDFCVGSSNAAFKNRVKTLYEEGQEDIRANA